MSLSVTVGIPNSRVPPVGFAISTRRAACGRYVPFRSSDRMCNYRVLRCPTVCSMVSPSAPALPLLPLTRFHASTIFSRQGTCSSRSSRPMPSGSRPANRASSRVEAARVSPSLPSASDAVSCQELWLLAFLLVWSFVDFRLLRPLLTSRSAFRRCPFRHKARSPQVRTRYFPAQPPALHDFALATKASQWCV